MLWHLFFLQSEVFRICLKKVSRETKSIKKLPSIQLFLDVSSTNTGVAILLEDGRVMMDSINLKRFQRPPCMSLTDYEKVKIGVIKEYLDKLEEEYRIDLVCVEGIFIRPGYNQSSQILLKLHGFLMGYFLDTPFISIPPSNIKKAIAGKGNAKKEEVRGRLEEVYQYHFRSDDESDAMALLVTYKGHSQYQIEQKEDTYGI